MTTTAHERALLLAEKSYRDHIEGRPMKYATDAYLQALLDDAETVEAVNNSIALGDLKDGGCNYGRQTTCVIATLKRMGGV